MAKVTQVDFPPKELVSYSKETQKPTAHTQPKDGTAQILPESKSQGASA